MHFPMGRSAWGQLSHIAIVVVSAGAERCCCWCSIGVVNILSNWQEVSALIKILMYDGGFTKNSLRRSVAAKATTITITTTTSAAAAAANDLYKINNHFLRSTHKHCIIRLCTIFRACVCV